MGESNKIGFPKVSVIIPVYNTGPYVRQTVDSILNQTLNEIEIIVIDDGSTDNSWDEVSNMARTDSRIRLFQQENKGLSRSRNRGLELAHGEYIYFMDSDDVLHLEALEVCYNTCVNQLLDFVFFDADVFSDSDQDIRHFDYSRSAMDPNLIYQGIEALKIQLSKREFRSSVCLNFISQAYLTKKSFLFYPDILHEDQLFTVQLYLRASKVRYIGRTFFHRRVRADSIMTSRFAMKNMKGYLTVARELQRLEEMDTDGQNVVNLFISQMLNAAIWQAHTCLLYTS